jgi:serine/threonine protein kinase
MNELKKKFELREKRKSEAITNFPNISLNNNNKQKENKPKEKEIIKKSEIKEEKKTKDIKTSTNTNTNNQKNANVANQNKSNAFSNNIFLTKNSINLKKVNNSSNINTNKNIKPKEANQESANNKNVIKEKEAQKNNDNNINNSYNNFRTSTPASIATNQNNKIVNANNVNNTPSKKMENKLNKNINQPPIPNAIKPPIKPKDTENINKKEKKEKEKDNIKRINSFYKLNNNMILKDLILEDESKIERKNKSIKNKEVKIDLTLKKVEPEKHIFDDYEDIDIMKIDDITQERNTNDSQLQNQGLKRTKTSNQKIVKDIPEKKRHSLLDDNNSLTIKLKSKNNYNRDDFEVVTFSGKGAYGTVLQVYLKNDPKKKIYAIKKLDINSLYSVNRLYQAYLENDILNELDSPYIVKVYGAFEADGKIHLIMDYLSKGDLSYFIKTNFPLKDEIIRFYSAEIVLFLEYMQSKRLIHRDLKPQNIMIDERGHLKVIDFGTVRKLGYYYDKREMRFKEEKVFERIDSEDIKGVKNIVNPDEEDADEDDFEDEEDEDEENEEDENEITEKKKKRIQKVRTKRSMTFVGTAEYISPEVIGDRPAEFGTDIWAFGVMLYQMYYNSTPFKAITTYLTFRNIEKPQISFPDDKIPEQAKDLILKILVPEPKKRLGGGDPGTPYDITHLKKHAFFKKIKWNNLQNTTPPGIKDYKFYECKKKSIYKNQNNNDEPDIYQAFDDKSKEKKNVKIIKQGYIKKKSTWFHYEKRHITLDTSPSIILKDDKDDKYFREIILNKKCKVTIVENNCFDLKTEDKTHRFKGMYNDGNDWAGIIVDAITAYCKD